MARSASVEAIHAPHPETALRFARDDDQFAERASRRFATGGSGTAPTVAGGGASLATSAVTGATFISPSRARTAAVSPG